jgi:hypothetical protein
VVRDRFFFSLDQEFSLAETPPPPPSPPPADADSAATIRRLVDELEQHQKGTRTALLVGSLVLVLILVIFGIGLYTATTSNLSPDQLEPALMKRVEARTPELQRKATEALTLALPTYQELAREKIKQISPRLRERAAEQFEQMPERLRERLSDRMQQLQTRTEQQLETQIKQRFDELPPERVDALTLHFADELQRVGTEVQASLEQKYLAQSRRLQQVLSKFDVQAPADLSDQDLQMKLIENTALLVVHMARNPEELPVLPGTGAGPATDPSNTTDTEEVTP